MIKMRIEQPKDGYHGQTYTECPHCGKLLSFYSTLSSCQYCSTSFPNMRALK
jgi:ribosomal protein S14